MKNKLSARFIFLNFVFALVATAAQANSGITYHGRILRPDGITPVTSSATQFRIQVRTPGVENCLLWEEQQTKDLSSTEGVFTLTIADSAEPTLIANTLPYSLERIFSNRTPYVALTGCSVGNSYTPSSSADGRSLQVYFREQPTDPWEQMPTTKVNFVPLALNSVQLEGYQAKEFLKIDPLSTYTPLTAANVNSLVDLIAGTSNQYLKPSSTFAGDVTGTSSTTVVEKIRGTNVVATAPTAGQVLKFDGTNWTPATDATGGAPADASYTVKGIVQINTDLATSGLFIAGGVLALPNVVTAGGPTGNAQTVPVITYDQKGRLTAVSTATIDDTTKLPLAGGTMTGNINMGTHDITNATNIAATNASVRNLILNDNDTNTVTIKTPADIAANYALTLPINDGAAGEVLSTDGNGVLSWVSSSAGSVTSVSSANNYLTVATPTTTPVLTVNVGTVANTVAAGDDARIVNAVQQAAYAADLAPAALCTNVQTPYWNTVADLWACQNIGTVPNATTAVNFTGSLAGDVSGTQGATSVDKIKGKTVSAATAVNQIMIYDGTNWVNNILSGDATLLSTGVLTLKNTGTAGTYYKVTTDAQGRVTSGSALATGDITTALGYTPVNKAGDTMNGTLGLFQTAADPSTAGWNATQKGYSWFNTTSNQVKYWDGSAIQALGVSGAGLTSLGGQSGSTQTFAAGASGTAPAIASAANVHTLNVPLASGAGVTSGTISKTDYDAFTAKLTSPLTTKGDLLTRDATTHVRLPAGTDGQVLQADSAQTSGLKWNTLSINSLLPSQATNSGKFLTTDGTNVSWSPVTSGTVTSVSSTNAYASVATPTTTPAITINVGTAANTLAAGDDSRIVNAVQQAAYAADLAPAALCTNVQTPYWNTVSDLWACQNINAAAMGAFVDGGNTMTATATVGTNSNHDLEIETNATTKMTVKAGGNVGIGTTSPDFALSLGNGSTVDGALIARGYGTVGTNGQTLTAAGAGTRMIWYPKKAAFRAGAVSGTEWDDANIGNYSSATGYNTIASGVYATAMNSSTTSSGNYSTAMGFSTTASGHISFATGNNTTASGQYSATFGQSTTAESYAQTTLGRYNLPLGTETASSWVATDPLFVVGNGTGSGASRSTAMMILKNGNVGIGTTSPNTILDFNGALSTRGMAAPALSPAGQGRMYFDSTSNTYKISQNGSAYADILTSATATGDITDVVAGAGLTGGATSGSATLDIGAGTGIIVNANDVAVDVGTAAGKIVQVQAGGKLPALDGSDLTNLDAGDIATGTLPIARGGTGQVTAVAALNALLPAQATNAGKVLQTDGTNATWTTPAATGVTSVTSANSYLSVATTTTTPVITANVGTAANTLAAGDDARITGALQTTAYNADVLPAASCTTSQTAYWNTVADTWACQNINVSSAGGFFKDGGNSFGANASIGTNDNFDLNIKTNNTTKMTVLKTGEVGIGTTSPVIKLDVVDGAIGVRSGTVQPQLSVWAQNANTLQGELNFQASRTNGTVKPNSNDVLGVVTFGNISAQSARIYGVASENHNGTSAGAFLAFQTAANTTTTPLERMRIDQNGNVGIGLISPATKLDVAGGIKIGTEASACAAGLSGTLRYNGGNVEFCNGTSWQAFGVSGGGITSLGGQTGATQTFANGTTGTAPAFSSATNVHTLNIPLASGAGVTSGTISKTDYDSFVAKLTSPLTTKGDLLTFSTVNARLPAGTNGQVLQADSTQTTGLKWATPNAGTVTSVTSANSYLSIATTTTTPVITANVGTAANTLAAGDDARIVGAFVNGGNSYTAAATIGTNDNFALNFETNGTTKLSIQTDGSITTTGNVEVGGQVLSTVVNNAAATTFNFDNGNMQYTSASCGAMTLQNMRDGGTYTIAVQGTTQGTCTFTHGADTFLFSPANGPTVSGTDTTYHFTKMGSKIYVTWVAGYQ